MKRKLPTPNAQRPMSKAQKKPTQQEIKRLRVASAIAREIFTAGDGKRATRLALIDEVGRDRGGWGESPVRDIIERRLRKFTLFNNSRS